MTDEFIDIPPQDGSTSTNYIDLPPVIPAAVPDSSLLLTNVMCDASVYVGAVVRMALGIAVNAIATSLLTSNAIGVVENKTGTTSCDIRVLGVTPALFAGLNESKEYYLSESVAGAMTTVAPSAPGAVIVRIGQPFSPTRFLVVKGTRVQRAL